MKYIKSYNESQTEDIFEKESGTILEILFEIFDEFSLHDSYEILSKDNINISRNSCDGGIYISNIDPIRVTNIMNELMMMSGRIRSATDFFMDLSIIPQTSQFMGEMRSSLFLKFYYQG
jgi:hypothetical protein